MKIKSQTVMVRDTICFSGNFISGATPGTIKAGEQVRILEFIVRSLSDGTSKLRVKARGGRWAWVGLNDVQS